MLDWTIDRFLYMYKQQKFSKLLKYVPYISELKQGTNRSLVSFPYISELKQGTNRSLVSFTSLVISSDNVNRGLVLLLLLCLIYKLGHN